LVDQVGSRPLELLRELRDRKAGWNPDQNMDMIFRPADAKGLSAQSGAFGHDPGVHMRSKLGDQKGCPVPGCPHQVDE
jgi:hypothetical protein